MLLWHSAGVAWGARAREAGEVGRREDEPSRSEMKVLGGRGKGLLRELNPGPLAPEARIIPLDQAANAPSRARCARARKPRGRSATHVVHELKINSTNIQCEQSCQT